MKTLKYKLNITAVLLCVLLISCEDFVEVESANHTIISETLFNNDETARSAMVGIYNQLAAVPFSSGGSESVTILAGLSGDVLSPIRSTNIPYMEFEQHEISPDNLRNFSLWSSAYNVIYMTNALLEGLANSQRISEEVKHQLEGEARFVRAFTFFYLVNLYGEVPLILTTDYRVNALASRTEEEQIYQQILEDLETSETLLGENYLQGERTQVTRYTAMALMARIHLYSENWEQAEYWSSAVISNNSTYGLVEELNQVFLANSREAIWQLSPLGRGTTLTNTSEAANLIIHPFLAFLSHLKLGDSFVSSLQEEDKRLKEWISFHQGEQSFYANKYKVRNSTDEVTEYSMVLRLAEQFLIRAEARTMLGKKAEAIRDVDKIRERAGLESLENVLPAVSEEQLLEVIMDERKRELFAEWGHRWLDLKRTGKADDVLGVDSSLWQATDMLYPIPEQERMKNPNISQNNGY